MQHSKYNDPRARAKKAVRELKGFYIHLFVYFSVVVGLIAMDWFTGKDDSSFGISWGILFWGIGVLAHGCAVYIPYVFFNSAWEKRMVQKIVNKYGKPSPSDAHYKDRSN
ncbi:2TM domain-containing protein [Planobacterium oryzisoli]|uniref:2TM domain-containing protein n=1 Tax=Planobacterium oryzisoli TaxID=2771435 RepID=A0A930YWB5_9FLAO|nr:2TM domain-containing protein [Planobacterium oryzisoli]MBF5027499.1 2TM domain-containing protein [Planobacterium oryzisoli]